MRCIARATLNLRWRRLKKRIAKNKAERDRVSSLYQLGDCDPADLERVCTETQRLAELAAQLRRDVDRAGVTLEP